MFSQQSRPLFFHTAIKDHDSDTTIAGHDFDTTIAGHNCHTAIAGHDFHTAITGHNFHTAVTDYNTVFTQQSQTRFSHSMQSETTIFTQVSPYYYNNYFVVVVVVVSQTGYGNQKR